MANLVTLEEVNNALKYDLDLGDGNSPSASEDAGQIADLQEKIEQASDVVLDYLKNPEGSEDWNDNEDRAPAGVRAATIIVVQCLVGDLENSAEILAGLQGGEPQKNNPVVALLYRRRDPAIA